MTPRPPSALSLLTTVACGLLLQPIGASGAADPRWVQTPYQVEVRLALAGGPCSDPGFADAIAEDVRRRMRYRLGRFWKTELIVESGERLSALWQTIAEEQPNEPNEPSAYDKRMLVSAVQEAEGYSIVAREHDPILSSWSAPTRETGCPHDRLAAGIVARLLEAFRPTAHYEVDTESPKRVRLIYRASEMAPGAPFSRATEGQVMLPYRVKVSRDGTRGAAKRVRWTYLIAGDTSEEPPIAETMSHTRLPFGARRRGRVEQIAIAAPVDPLRNTTLRLHSVEDPAVPLPGYSLLVGAPGADEPLLAGRSDPSGLVVVPSPEDDQAGKVVMAHLKYGSLVVASLPVAPGVDRQIDVPLLDERQRLKAELRVNALREELIDLVARRSIYAARIRRLIKEEKTDQAERLVRELETLPGRAQFNQKLNSAEQSLRATNPMVQKRIDRLIAQTRQVLGASLDARQVRRLATEVLEAQRAADTGRAEDGG